MSVTISGSSGIASVDGSAASPSVRGSDANSGILYTADAIKFSTGGTQRAIIDNNGLSSAGHILQVLQAFKTDQSTLSSTSMADVPSLSIAITPASTSNKILVIANVYASCSDAAVLGLMRDSTVIGAGAGGDADNSGFAMVRFTATNLGSTFSVSYLDSPSTTSATTYKVRARPTEGSNNLFINRRASSDGYKLSSSITVMEVAG